MRTLGIALSGGGVPGCAHIGVLRALEEEGIEVHALAGSSCGALVAALYACGHSASDLASLVPFFTRDCMDYDLRGFARSVWKRGRDFLGFANGERIRQLLDEWTGGAAMSQLDRPVALMAVDLVRGRRVIFSSRPLIPAPANALVVTDVPVTVAVMASCAVPVLFKPVKVRDMMLVDGGVLENCPVSVLPRLGAERVMAVNLVEAPPMKAPLTSCQEVLLRSVTVNLTEQARSLVRQADLVLEPDVCSIGMLHFEQAQHCLEEGYACARERMDDIRLMIEEKAVTLSTS